MKNKTLSLRKQFLLRIFIVLVIIVIITGGVQTFVIKQQINNTLTEQSTMLAQGIEHGIKATDFAGKSIEHQIDLKLLSYAYHIGDLLKGKEWKDISNEELVEIKDKLHLSGITILAEESDDIIGVRATDPKEIGFSFKKIGYMEGYLGMLNRLNGKTPDANVSYAEEHANVLQIAQSGSHGDEPVFNKYAYYVIPGTNYIINPYIEANEIYQYTTVVGPQTWIETVMKENPYVDEIAVINPQVFKNPDLETKLYPPMKKILYGSIDSMDSEEDLEAVLSFAEQSGKAQVSYIDSTNGDKSYKLFLPINDEQMIYASLDYNKIVTPMYRYSTILIISGLVAIFALFLVTARFFSRIYENIQRIKSQINSLEGRDFTAKSVVNDNSELGDLSASANRMVDTLHGVLLDTSDQSSKVQRQSLMLENDANQSVEKMYAISTETTMKQRGAVEDILDFINMVEVHVKTELPNNKVEEILGKLDTMKLYAKDRASATTDFTITLSDLLHSLHSQSKELSGISNALLQNIHKFKL